MTERTVPEGMFDVDGVLLPRPFKVRRFGHFGRNCRKLDESREFWVDHLGFRLTEERDLFSELPPKMAKQAAEVMTDPRMFFTTHETDHHSLLLAHEGFGTYFGHTEQMPDNTISQLTWQVGSLQEVVDGHHYLKDRGVPMVRSGRDMPGSNWHVYFLDPDGTTIELFYGMEQIGWDRRSKPEPMHARAFHKVPELPQISELTEIQQAQDAGVDLSGGYRPDETDYARDTVLGGVLVPRPFKVTEIGPITMFTPRMDAMVDFYTDVLGFELVETAQLDGHPISYLRFGARHHTLVLVDKQLRSVLGLNPDNSCLAVGMQLGGYRQLLDAAAYLTERGYRTIELPRQLHLGIEQAIHVVDPDGQLVQLFYSMETIGWDGKPRPREESSPAGDWTTWPRTIAASSDVYADHAFRGPIE